MLPVRGPSASPFIFAITAARAPDTIVSARGSAALCPSSLASPPAAQGRSVVRPAARHLVQPVPRPHSPRSGIFAYPVAVPAASHEWLQIVDPENKHRVWLFDITFLLSSWHCLYGAGCPGMEGKAVANSAVACCGHGAYLMSQQDLHRTARFARQLTDADWQLRAYALKRGFFGKAEVDEDGQWYKTRVVDGACIFMNRKGFATGPGCALHQHAIREGISPVEVKPQVCWLVPLFNPDKVLKDGTTVSIVQQFDRAKWGEGGKDLRWWCTQAPEAYTGDQPFYQSNAEELRRSIDDDMIYRKLVAELKRRERGRPRPLVHPMQALARKRGLR
jgi:hypothetical protein